MLRKIIIGCHILGLSTVFSYAQNKLYINLKAGNQTEQSLENIKSITFPGSVFKVNSKNGSGESTPITSIKFVKFDKPLPTGLSNYESDRKTGISIYPNPAQDNNVTVSYNLKSSGLVLIEVLSMNGLVQSRYNGSGIAGDNHTQLILNDLTAGVYICRVKSGDRTLTAKIIKY